MKHLLLVTLALCAATFSYGQAGLELGVQLQYHNMWVMNSDEADLGPELDYEGTYGMGYGLQGALNFSDNMGVGIGLMISRQGQKYVGNGEMGWTSAEKRLSYTKIPVYLKLNTNPFVGTSFLFHIGPQFAFLNSARYFENDVERTQVNIGNTLYENYKDGYKSMDLGGMIAFGARFNISDNLHISALLRFDGTIGTIEDMEQTNFPIFFNNVNFASERRTNASRLTPDRRDTRNLTGGLNIALNYVLN